MARLALSVLVATLMVLFGGRASAEQNNPKATPVYVLDIDTEDSDDQAEALTSALRARVRSAQGWSLTDTTQSLGKLIVVLKCPVRPDAACLQRIGDQLKADRFIWGQMTKKDKQVTVELHLWSRGKPDVRAAETYSENLKDPNDESLKKVAAKLFAGVTGSVTSGTVTVRANGAASGMVLVDGAERARLDAGVAKLDVPAGAHAIEVRAPGFEPWSQQVNVPAGGEQEVVATLAPSKGEPPPVIVKSNLPIKKYAAYGLVGLGVVSIAVGVFEGIKFLGAKGDLNDERGKVSSSVTDVCADLSTNAAINACQNYKNAKDARTLGLIFGGIGAALVAGGVVLLVTDKPTEGGPPKDQALRVIPTLSPTAAGIDVSLRF